MEAAWLWSGRGGKMSWESKVGDWAEAMAERARSASVVLATMPGRVFTIGKYLRVGIALWTSATGKLRAALGTDAARVSPQIVVAFRAVARGLRRIGEFRGAQE